MQDSFEEDDVELIDYLRVIWCRRKLIVFGTFISVLLAGGVSLMTPKTYEVTSHIQLGRVWGKAVGNPYLTRELIGSEAFHARIIEKLGLQITAQDMIKAETIEIEVIEGGAGNVKVPLLLSVRVRANLPQQAVRITETLATFLIETHLSRFDERLKVYKNYEEDLVLEVGRIKLGIDELERLIKRQQMDPEADASSAILLQSQLGQKAVQLLNYKKELKEARIKNSSKLDTENTKMVSRPITPENHVASKVKRNIAVAGIIGLFISLVLSFFLEYLLRVQARESTPAAE